MNLKRIAGRLRIFWSHFKEFWYHDIQFKKKPIIVDNHIEYTDGLQIVEIRARLSNQDTRKIQIPARNNPSYLITLSKPCALEFLNSSPDVTVRDMTIEYMRTYDKDGAHLLENVAGERSLLITRLLDRSMTKK